MARALQRRSASAQQARGILRRQVKKGLKELAGGDRATDADIHEARKRIKEARATLRLLRKVLSRADYRREDRLLRDAARPLSAARDAKVLVEAFDGLGQRHHRARHIKGGQRLRQALVNARGRARRALTDGRGVRRTDKLLRKARAQVKHWPLRHDGWRPVATGAVRRYAKGRRALQDVRSERTAERLHHWRKQAKYLYLQLELLAPICAPFIARLAHELRRLSDDLGEDHDLAMLQESVAALARDVHHEVSATTFLSLIERSRNHLQRRALSRGGRLYRVRPARLAAILGV